MTVQQDSPSDFASECLSAQLRRRRAASLRCLPMPDGRRDPLEPEDDPIFTRQQVDDWAMALLHLKRSGLPVEPPDDVARALAADPQRYRHVLPRPVAVS